MRLLILVLMLGGANSALAQEDSATPPSNLEEAVEGLEEEPGDTASGELTEEQIEALIQARRDKRRKERMKRRSFLPDKSYNREFLAILGLLMLWLWTRKHNRDVEAKRPVRASPLSPDEMGRVVFALLRSKDSMAFRALFLNGAESRDLMGQEEAESYLESRTGPRLEKAFRHLVTQVPVGASYKECIITEEVCYIDLLCSDGSEQRLNIGRVALVGAVIRLVSPSSG